MDRREMLATCANGFGALALLGLLADESAAASAPPGERHHPAKAKSVIFLYMDGGPSQMDTFDPKPRLARDHGKPLPFEIPATQFNSRGTILKSPWEFKRYGQSGLEVSDLFPEVGQMADDLCVIRSMTSNFSEHTNANYFLHTGNGQQGRPSMGAWVTYGLGSECKDLPGFVVLSGGLVPPGGADCFGSGFLPPDFQGSVFRHGPNPVADLQRGEPSEADQRRKLDLIGALDRGALVRLGPNPQVEAAIANYELAFRMQAAVPDLMDFGKESAATRQLYGLDDAYAPTRIYAAQCLIARRLVERGVRFIELTCPNVGADRWDQHGDLETGHRNNAKAVDRPIAGLLRDLKSRGLLDSTLVLWGGEFGRTPMAQGTNGRDHNPFGFTMWMAGGGVKGGTVYGETDEFGYYTVKDKVEMYDLHATLLHLLGVDHKRLTVRFGGRDMRLTDVHGNVLTPLLA
jgi:hypothetical protein